MWTLYFSIFLIEFFFCWFVGASYVWRKIYALWYSLCLILPPLLLCLSFDLGCEFCHIECSFSLYVNIFYHFCVLLWKASLPLSDIVKISPTFSIMTLLFFLFNLLSVWWLFWVSFELGKFSQFFSHTEFPCVLGVWTFVLSSWYFFLFTY